MATIYRNLQNCGKTRIDMSRRGTACRTQVAGVRKPPNSFYFIDYRHK